MEDRNELINGLEAVFGPAIESSETMSLFIPEDSLGSEIQSESIIVGPTESLVESTIEQSEPTESVDDNQIDEPEPVINLGSITVEEQTEITHNSDDRAFEASQEIEYMVDEDDDDDSTEEAVEESTTEEVSNNESDLILDFRAEIVQDNEYQSRFKGAEWFNSARNKVVTHIGLGGIGSYAAMLISRFSPRTMYLYDLDSVDGSNISGQFYKTSQINKPKAFCIRDNMDDFSGYKNAFAFHTDATEIRYNKSDIFILGLDSMDARRRVVEKICREVSDNVPWIIDGRLSMRTLQVFCFKPGSGDFSKYMSNFMFSDKEADEVVCSMKQTSFMANMIGSMISNVYMSICLQEVSRFPYGVPFMVEYDCLTYQLKTYINGEAALKGIRGEL